MIKHQAEVNQKGKPKKTFNVIQGIILIICNLYMITNGLFQLTQVMGSDLHGEELAQATYGTFGEITGELIIINILIFIIFKIIAKRKARRLETKESYVEVE